MRRPDAVTPASVGVLVRHQDVIARPLDTPRDTIPTTSPSPLDMFAARCEARAHLYAAGEIPDLHDAVDELQRHAERHGLVSLIGQDRVQQIMAEAFRPVRAMERAA